MKNTKVKLKNFVKEHEKQLKVVACIGVTIVGGAIGGYALKNAYLTGVAHGSLAGVGATISWFDKTFEKLELQKLYDTYVQNHPEEIISCTEWIRRTKKEF